MWVGVVGLVDWVGVNMWRFECVVGNVWCVMVGYVGIC